jgi:predicted MFS family arabinose efflux permease
MNNELDINSRKSIVSMIYMTVVGVCVFIIQPGIVQGFVSELGLAPEQAGYAASAEMWGLAITTVLLTYFADRVDWRKITIAALLLAVAGNLASTLSTDVQTFTIIRTITGLGLGAMISLPFAMLGMTEKTDYNFGLALVWILAYGAAGLFLIPSALASIGLDGIFIFIALFCGLGLFLVPNLPRGAQQETDINSIEDGKFRFQKISALAGVFVFNLAIGAVWAFLFLVGINANIEEQGVANILTISQILGMLGALLVVFLSSKVSREAPLGIAILFCAVGIGFLLLGVDFFIYSIAVYTFNFFWNMVVPYIMATLAAFNDNSKTVIRGSCMQMLGIATGPYIAARIVGSTVPPSYDTVNLFGVVMISLSLILILPAILALRGRD